MTKLLSSSRAAAAVTMAVLAVGLSGCVESDRAEIAGTSASCPFTPDESITTTARIAYQNIPNGDLVVKDQGVLEACMPNAEITWTKYDSGADVVQGFGSNSVDLGLLGSSPATKALSAPLNIDMKIVWLHDVIGAAESLVAKDPSVRSIEDLRGKTIAVAFSSTSHYSLLTALRSAGLDPATDVSLINLSPDKMVAAWQSESVDAAWVWDPTLSVLSAGGTIVTGSDVTAKAGAPTFDAAGATSQFIADNQEFMDTWTRAQDYAVGFIAQDPKAAAVSMAVQLGAAPENIERQLAGYTYLSASQQNGADYFGAKLATDLTHTAEFLLGEGGVDAVSSPQVYSNGVYKESIAKVAAK